MHGESTGCPRDDWKWWFVLNCTNSALALISKYKHVEARQLLADAIDVATRSLHAAFACPMGVAAAYRVLALAHFSDPVALSSDAWPDALKLALRFQHLAIGWIVSNGPVDINASAAIDDNHWPIRSEQFRHERQHVLDVLAGQGGSASRASEHVQSDVRIPGMKLAIVSVCAYSSGTLFPQLATSAHEMYAHRHGYGYSVRWEANASGRPPHWGKVRAMEQILSDERWDWALWIDCDTYFMDLNKTIDSVMLRYGQLQNSAGISPNTVDPEAHMFVTEDYHMVNSAIFLMRRSAWSLEFLRRVWGPDDSAFIHHLWYEQAAFAQALLGNNHRRSAGVDYAYAGSQRTKASLSPYPREVRVVPQFEMNSYHPISAFAGDSWAPGHFVLSFNGLQWGSSPAVASVIHANYYDLLCRSNAVQNLCLNLSERSFAPWLPSDALP